MIKVTLEQSPIQVLTELNTAWYQWLYDCGLFQVDKEVCQCSCFFTISIHKSCTVRHVNWLPLSTEKQMRNKIGFNFWFVVNVPFASGLSNHLCDIVTKFKGETSRTFLSLWVLLMTVITPKRTSLYRIWGPNVLLKLLSFYKVKASFTRSSQWMRPYYLLWVFNRKTDPPKVSDF